MPNCCAAGWIAARRMRSRLWYRGMAVAGEDAEAAFRSIQVLAADPVRSIPYLRKQIRPVAVAEEKRLQQWLADLDPAHRERRKY